MLQCFTVVVLFVVPLEGTLFTKVFHWNPPPLQRFIFKRYWECGTKWGTKNHLILLPDLVLFTIAGEFLRIFLRTIPSLELELALKLNPNELRN